MESSAGEYAEVVKLFGLVLNQYRLYSDKHPAAQAAIRGFLSRLEPILTARPSLTLGIVEGKLIFNDQPVDEKTMGLPELVREFQRFNIDSLIVEGGVSEEEIVSFFRVLATPPRILDQKGGFGKALEEASLEHIRLGTSRYKMVKEEEEVVERSEIGTGEEEGQAQGQAQTLELTQEQEQEQKQEDSAARSVHRMERMEQVIDYYVQGDEGEVDFDLERLAYEVEKKSDAVAKLMVERPSDIEVVTRLALAVSRFLHERLAQPFIREGKDFSPAVSRLAKHFKKTLQSPESPDSFRGSADDLVSPLERAADAIKLELIVRVYQESGGDLDSLVKWVTKLLRGKEARERLLGALRERLFALGVSGAEFERAFAATEEKRTPKSTRKTGASAEELEELRQVKERFDEEVALQVKQRTEALERERRRALQEKERVDNIIRNLGEGLVVVDVDGKVQVMNPAAEKMLGVNNGQSRGTPLTQFMKDEHLLALARGPLRDDSDPVTREIELRSLNDETRRVLQASTAVIENEDGKTVGMVSVISDITQKKQLDEAKSKFVSHVSHELRTPLLAIEQSLSLLLGKELGAVSEGQEKFLTIAHQNINRLSRLVNDLLDVAKLEAGKIEIRPTAFELGKMLHHVVETVQGWAGSKQLTVEERYPDQDLSIEADPDRLVQVVTNLLGNAIKFTPRGGTISVELDPEWNDPAISPEPCVAVSVQDSGIGIPEEDQQRVFEKFEQVSLSAPEGVSSTGLGLTIAKEIVELHGGRIWLESREGQGSRFTFAIPRRFNHSGDAEPATQSQDP